MILYNIGCWELVKFTQWFWKRITNNFSYLFTRKENSLEPLEAAFYDFETKGVYSNHARNPKDFFMKII